MRTSYSRTLRIISAVTLTFFSWTFLSLWQIPAALAAEKQKPDARTQTTDSSRRLQPARELRPEEKFETAVEAIREKAGKASEKEAKGEDDSAEIEAIKAKKTEIESLDLELKKEFAGTEQRLKAAKLPKEILARHAAFVEHYTSNVNSLRKELDDIDSAKNTADRKAKIEKVRLHLEKVKAPSRHQKLDPENLPFKARKITKTREPRLDKKSFEKEFSPQRSQRSPRTEWNPPVSPFDKGGQKGDLIPAANEHQWQRIKQKPTLLAFNETASDIPFTLPRPTVGEGWGEGVAPQLAFSDSAPIILAQAAIQPMPDDLAETPEVQFTPAIRDLAAQLGNKPNRILEWVQNNIEFVPTYGSIQGADMCLQSRQCNAYDTNSLLISLLRVSNLPAHFVYGTIEVPIDTVKNWAGGFSDPRAAVNFIASGGIPIKPYVSGGVITKVQMEHVWVETYIPYGNYRGAIMDQSLKTWIPMDGSFKQYTYTNGFDITAKVPFDQNAYLSKVQSQNPVHYYQSQIQNYLDANMPDTSIVDVKGYREITQEKYHFLPSTLYYKTLAVAGKFTSIPASMQATVAFTITDPAGTETAAATFSLPEIAGKRITLSYIPATADDEALIANYGGFLYDVPAYMLHLKPVLRIDGTIKLTGEATTLGSEQTMTLQFNQPNGLGETVNKKVFAGAYYAVGMDLQGINENVLGKRNYKLNTSVLSETAGTLGNDDLIGEHLFILATTYHLANDKIYKAGAKLYNTVITRTLSESITSFTLSVSHLFSIPKSAMPSGINMDVAMDRVIAVAKDGDTAKEKAYMDIAGLVSSYHEHDIFEKIDGFSSVSAVRALQVAAAGGIPIQHINAANMAQILPALQVGVEIKTDIQNAINAGKEVTIPQTNVQINDWNGVGFIVKDPLSGSGSFVISGGLAGSDSTSQSDGMQIVELFKTPLGWINDALDLLTRNNVAEAAELESFELAGDEGAIESAIVGGVNFCATYYGVGQCTGLVYKAYKAAGIYLFGESLKREGGNYKYGLDIIWGIPQTGYQTDILIALTNKQKIYKNAGVRTTCDPLKGDIIFFNNTYIRDKTKSISQQGITHVGIVLEGPDSDFNIRFAHASNAGVSTENKLNIVNLTKPSTVLRSSPRATAADLFAGFGTIRNVLPNILSTTGN